MKRKVLIVDDEPNIVTALEFLFEQRGYEVLVAMDGEEALALAESYRPDVMLLDVMMPKRSGYEVCQRVREHPEMQHVRVVMLSAKGREAEVSKGLSLGADLYITKPFSTQELVERVDALLGAGAKPGDA